MKNYNLAERTGSLWGKVGSVEDGHNAR